MRKFMSAVVTVAGMGLAAVGCNDRDRAARQQDDLARTEVKANQDIANTRLDAAKQKADIDRRAQQTIADREREVENKRRDMAMAANDAVAEHTLDRQDAVGRRTRNRQDALDKRNDMASATAGAIGTGTSVDRARVNATDGSMSGVLTSTFGSRIELRDARGNKEKLKTDELTRVTENGRAVRITDFKQGTEVRVSFTLNKDHDKVARDVQVLTPVLK